MVIHQFSKLRIRVRFPELAPHKGVALEELKVHGLSTRGANPQRPPYYWGVV